MTHDELVERVALALHDFSREHYYGLGCFRSDAERLIAIIGHAVLEEAAGLCDEHAKMYPPDVFASNATAGPALKWKCELLAKEIRAMAKEGS